MAGEVVLIDPQTGLSYKAGSTGATTAAPTFVQATNNTATAGTDLSGTATTTSGGYSIAANANRKPGDVQGQNVSTVPIGFNEFGGTAAIGSAGTWTVPAGGTFSITTNRLVNFIASSGTAAVTVTSV